VLGIAGIPFFKRQNSLWPNLGLAFLPERHATEDEFHGEVADIDY